MGMISVKKCTYGRGVFAEKKISYGRKITNYLGLLVPVAEIDSIKSSMYVMSYSRKYVLDGDIPCNVARFINHSPNPNCEARECDSGIGIFALKSINRGEQLFLHYGYKQKDMDKKPEAYTWYRGK